MKIRAVIFDVYQTLLEVGPPPRDAERRWGILCLKMFHGRIPLHLREFHTLCDVIIAREHAAARATGIAYPEIFWPDVAAEALPDLGSLPREQREEFLARHAELRHSIRLMPGAGDALQTFAQQKLLLGIASNAQPYTLRELDHALASACLSRSLFLPELTFWSFEHGFSKPDPQVFRLLSLRLQAHDVGARETLMVGDRQDNDMEPAKAQGWQTWRFSSGAGAAAWGDWDALCRRCAS